MQDGGPGAEGQAVACVLLPPPWLLGAGARFSQAPSCSGEAVSFRGKAAGLVWDRPLCHRGQASVRKAAVCVCAWWTRVRPTPCGPRSQPLQSWGALSFSYGGGWLYR